MRLGHWGMSLFSLLASPAMAAAPAGPAIQGRSGTFFVDELPWRRGSRHPHPGYRSRGKQARPRKRSNRLHISRRVRRAHRRSKAA
jgi:hypothetical protein